MATTTTTMTMTTPQAGRITQGGKEYIPHALPVLTSAFHNDQIFNYFMGALSEEERKQHLPELLLVFLKAGFLNRGIIFEVSSWGCCAMILPPGKRVDNPRTILQAGFIRVALLLKSTGIKRMLIEHATAVKRAKQKAFTPKEMSEFWYLFIIGTHQTRQRQGLGGMILEHVKAHALKDGGRPVWLEASNDNARKLYAKHGFEEVEEITLGIGLVGSDGLAKKGGEGVKTWGMVWRPDAKNK